MSSEKPCLPKGSSRLVEVDGARVRLSLRGLGHVPSFKNMKRAILDKKKGHMRTLTEPDAKAFMKEAIRSFESQLLYAAQTIAYGTTLAHAKLSLIASLLPLDDSRQWLPEIVILDEQVEPGQEGADIVIERIAPAGSKENQQ